MKKIALFCYQVLLTFAFLGILFIPFTFELITLQKDFTKFIFEDLIVLIGSKLKDVYISNPEISSDSTTLFILVFILFFLAIFLVGIFSILNIWKKNQYLIHKIILIIINYYLALIMLKYGSDKIFKVQFYLPEPNTLYTPLGMLDKDILFWSTMGSSYSYNIFMGVIEIVPALLLLYKKTRILGLLFLFGVLINVVAVNFCFDISVKLFSMFLLLMCFILLIPTFKKIIQFLFLNQEIIIKSLAQEELTSKKKIRYIIKINLLILFFIETFYPHLQNEKWNDDLCKRNDLHGAYEVLNENFEINKIANRKLKRIFIHRQNYLIFQYENDTLEDFQLEINTSKKKLTLLNNDDKKIVIQYEFSKKTDTLKLNFMNTEIIIEAKVLAWRKLPLLQPIFHLAVDEI